MFNKKPFYVLYTPVDMDKKFFLTDASNDFDPNSDYFKQWKFKNNLQGLLDIFSSNIEQAYNQYKKDNNWISLTDSLWQDYRSLFSSSSKQEHTPAQQNLITQYRKNADGHFRAAFNGTLLQFHDLHPEHAVLLLKRLLEYFIEEKDFKEFGSAPFTDDEIHKYNFFIRRIEAEIRTHQDRLKLKQLEDTKIIEASKEIITEELPAWDGSKQKAHALGFIRRSLPVPDDHEGPIAAYIKSTYKSWKKQWLEVLHDKYGDTYIEQNQLRILKELAFREYFYTEKRTHK